MKHEGWFKNMSTHSLTLPNEAVLTPPPLGLGELSQDRTQQKQ